MWKARASEKLGIIDARERAAIEYRDTLKEKWKFDPEVGRVSRYVSIIFKVLAFHLQSHHAVVRDTCRNLSTKPQRSNTRCWMLAVSRKSADGNILARGTANQKQSAKRWSSQSKHDNRISACVCRLSGSYRGYLYHLRCHTIYISIWCIRRLRSLREHNQLLRESLYLQCLDVGYPGREVSCLGGPGRQLLAVILILAY